MEVEEYRTSGVLTKIESPQWGLVCCSKFSAEDVHAALVWIRIKERLHQVLELSFHKQKLFYDKVTA